jgi:hypothetical protein
MTKSRPGIVSAMSRYDLRKRSLHRWLSRRIRLNFLVTRVALSTSNTAKKENTCRRISSVHGNSSQNFVSRKGTPQHQTWKIKYGHHSFLLGVRHDIRGRTTAEVEHVAHWHQDKEDGEKEKQPFYSWVTFIDIKCLNSKLRLQCAVVLFLNRYDEEFDAFFRSFENR